MKIRMAAALFVAFAGPAFSAAALAADDKHAEERLIIECIVRTTEKIPKIAGLSILSNHLERHGDMIEGAFLVKAVGQHIYFDTQCSIGPVSVTDLRGVTKTSTGVDKVWINLRIP